MAASNSTSGSGFYNFAYLGRSKSTCIPNFGQVSQFTAEISLIPVSENKRPPCWTSIFGFDFYACVTIGLSFCICLLNFVQIGPSATESWRHIHFQDGVHSIAILLPFLVFMTSLIWEGRNLHACIPNFDQISQSMAEILLLPVSENKRPLRWNSTSGSDFYVCVTIGLSIDVASSVTSLDSHIKVLGVTLHSHLTMSERTKLVPQSSFLPYSCPTSHTCTWRARSVHCCSHSLSLDFQSTRLR